MIDYWNGLQESNQVAFIIFVLVTIFGAIGYFIKRWIEKGSGIVNIGITAKDFADELKRREIQVRAELEQKHGENRKVLELELRNIQQQLQDVTTSYKAHINSLKERIVQLEAVRGKYPDALLDEAITALEQGDSQQADALFKQIGEDNEDTIKLVAEAAYQRGKIAEDAIRYLDALNHYEKAVRLAPDNVLYLNDAGIINYKLAFHKKAIGYYEQALASDLQTYGEDHPRVGEHKKAGGISL